MIKKEDLKKCTEGLMFEINDNEYDILIKEIELVLKGLDIANKFPEINEIEPLAFPFVTYQAKLRKDEVKQEIEVEDVLMNANNIYQNQVRVPKVVE